MQGQWRPEEGGDSPRIGVAGGCDLSCGYKELNQGPLKKQTVVLITEQSFQSHIFLKLWDGPQLFGCCSLLCHVLLGALPTNFIPSILSLVLPLVVLLVLSRVLPLVLPPVLPYPPHQFFIPPDPDTIFFAQWMDEMRLGFSSSEKKEDVTCDGYKG